MIGSAAAAAACLAAALCLITPLTMPAQHYPGRFVQPIAPERIARLPAFPLKIEGFATVKERRLLAATRLFEGRVVGSESVAITPDGKKLSMLDRWGRLHTASIADDGSLELDAGAEHIGVPGRPLGFAYDSQSRLVICDSVAGLLRYTSSSDGGGRMEILSSGLEDGTALRYIDDVAIGSDGSIYFSSASDQPVAYTGGDAYGASFYDTMSGAKLNLVSGTPTGRLAVWDAKTRRTRVLAENLFFANGVALSPAEDFVLVCETFGARVVRVWLNGTVDTFVDRLPGFPDGISRREGGGYWVSIVTPPSVLTWVAPLRPLRWLLAHLLPWLEPLVKKWGCVAHISESGAKQALLMDQRGERLQTVAAAHQHGRRLYLGNLMSDHVAYLDLEPEE